MRVTEYWIRMELGGLPSRRMVLFSCDVIALSRRGAGKPDFICLASAGSDGTRSLPGTTPVNIPKRLLIALPLFAVSGMLSQMTFDFIWRYFAWSNQTLAMIVLWVSAVYLVRCRKSHWIATVPATFMTAVSATYLFQAPEGFKLSTSIVYPAGVAVSIVVLGFSLRWSLSAMLAGRRMRVWTAWAETAGQTFFEKIVRSRVWRG